MKLVAFTPLSGGVNAVPTWHDRAGGTGEQNESSNMYAIFWATRNYGYYERGSEGTLDRCKRVIRREAGCRLRWRQEGDEIAAYKCKEDMEDEDKAYARIRPL